MSSLAREYQEKRDFIRMTINAPATLTLSDGSHYQVTCNDLSSSGAQLQSAQPIALHQTGTLIISSGGGSTQNLEAEITVCRLREQESNVFQVGVTINKFV